MGFGYWEEGACPHFAGLQGGSGWAPWSPWAPLSQHSLSGRLSACTVPSRGPSPVRAPACCPLRRPGVTGCSIKSSLPLHYGCEWAPLGETQVLQASGCHSSVNPSLHKLKSETLKWKLRSLSLNETLHHLPCVETSHNCRKPEQSHCTCRADAGPAEGLGKGE